MAEQRVQKVLADQGICSRREAERLIAAGKVKVNGHPVGLGDKMDPDFDKVMIDGKTVRANRLGLLKALYEQLNAVADISKLAV